MNIITRIFDKTMDWTMERPGMTIIILILIMIGIAVISSLLGIESSGDSFPIIIFM
jgi:hypothetical protein